MSQLIELLKKITFLKSAAFLSQLPPDEGAEVAFAGRSNAGKSTALNTITNIGNLAKTSKTPGRTQLINSFAINTRARLVDLPGYGYAKVPTNIKNRWENTLSEYLQKRQSLRGLCLLMDSRHPLKAFDQQMINWAFSAKLPLHILLTKTDKLSKNQAAQTLHQVKKALPASELITCQLFSALNSTGIDEVRKKLYQWLACCL